MPEPAQASMQRKKTTQTDGGSPSRHEHRTAKVVELIGVSTKSFEDAIRGALDDARQTTRGITGAHVENFSVRIGDGNITEYKVNLKVAFGIERTAKP